jgi:hypothetical protein
MTLTRSAFHGRRVCQQYSFAGADPVLRRRAAIEAVP